MKKYFTFINFIVVFCLVFLDFFIYIVLGLLFMNYEDHFDGTKGEFMSFQSMTFFEIMVYFGIIIWGLVNLFVLSYIFYRVRKFVISEKSNSN